MNVTPTSLISNQQKYNLNIFPNPASDFIKINGDNESLSKIKSVLITNSIGQEIKSLNYRQNMDININDLPAAVYYILLKSENEILKNISFIKN